MTYNQKQLLKWLHSQKEDVNAQLLLILLKKPMGILHLGKSTEIMPEILVEIDSKLLKDYKCELIKECKKASNKNFDFRLQYFKFKLNILDNKEQHRLIDSSHNYIKYTLLSEQLDIGTLYRLLYIVQNNSTDVDLDTLANIIGGASIFFARKYKIREYAMCILIALNIKNKFDTSFFDFAIEFLEYLQTKTGYFGYSNPFLIEETSINDILLNTFYCIWALENLYEIS